LNYTYKKQELESGLKVVSCRMPSRQSLALGIWLKIGGRYESAFNKGISHFLEHLLFKGSRKFSCRSIKESIEGIGGSLNAFTSEEFTCYWVKIPSHYIEKALDVLFDMVNHPLFPPGEIVKEKAVILEEVKMYRDQPQSYVHELLDLLLWKEQPLGMPIIGTESSVGRLERRDLLEFKKLYYVPSNAVLSIAGDFDYRRLIRKLAGKPSKNKCATPPGFLKARERQGKPQLKILEKDTEQTHMALGFHSLRRDHPLKHALAILHVILGANMSSRLFEELREKRGLAYEIGTQLRRFSDTGSFNVHAGIDNRKVTQTIDLILRELKKIKAEKVGAREFRRAKEFYLGQILLALEDTLEHMLFIGESLCALDKVHTLQDIIKEVDKVRPQDVQAVANDIFREEKMNLSMIGPLGDNEPRIYNHLCLRG